MSEQQRGLEIHGGKDAKNMLVGPALEDLVDHLEQHTNGNSKPKKTTREQLRRLLWLPTPKLDTGQKRFQAELEYVMQLRDKEQMYTATIDGEVAAMMGCRKTKDTHTGRDVYEICRSAVLPKFEDKGIFSALQKHVIDSIKTENSDCFVFLVSKHRKVKGKLERDGFEKVTIRRLLELRGVPSEKIEECAQAKSDEEGDWECWLLDLRTLQQ